MKNSWSNFQRKDVKFLVDQGLLGRKVSYFKGNCPVEFRKEWREGRLERELEDKIESN